MTSSDLILASASPRRRELLQQLGYRFRVVASDVDERWQEGDASVADHAIRLAREKALAAPDGAVVLAADTVVHLAGEVLGKPADRAEALATLARLSGREHEVITAVAVCSGGRLAEAVSRTRVWFRDLSEAERIAYWDSGEPADKAGSYAIQGLAAAFITRIDGSYSGVVGLPLFETAALLAQAGLIAPYAAGAAA